jgi:3-methyladenine DNA glycosylase AlkC
MNKTETTKRKGARSFKELSPNILNQLNKGEIPSANLVEWLAIDQKILLQNVLQQYQRTDYLMPILNQINALKKVTVNTINETIGEALLTQISENQDEAFLNHLATHPSDAVRCWVSYAIGKDKSLNIAQMLEAIKPFAADDHFGVREISWMAVRPIIDKNINESIIIFSQWVQGSDENIRRFASEATRPRGVWCNHIDILKKEPAIAMPILEPLKADPSKYVKDSVGNWLNDASKTSPDFVIQLCKHWETESDNKHTAYIIKKALRTLNKK